MSEGLKILKDHHQRGRLHRISGPLYLPNFSQTSSLSKFLPRVSAGRWSKNVPIQVTNSFAKLLKLLVKYFLQVGLHSLLLACISRDILYLEVQCFRNFKTESTQCFHPTSWLMHLNNFSTRSSNIFLTTPCKCEDCPCFFPFGKIAGGPCFHFF